MGASAQHWRDPRRARPERPLFVDTRLFSFFFSYGSAVDTRLVDSTKLGGTLGERQHWVCSVYTRGYARYRSEGDDQLVRGTCAVCTAVAASGQVKLFGSLHFTRYVGVCLREEERNIRVGRSQSSCRMASVRRTNFTGYYEGVNSIETQLQLAYIVGHSVGDIRFHKKSEYQ